jgi:hypothetical protein
MFPEEDEIAVSAKLAQLKEELSRHDLALLRVEDDLYAEQTLRQREVDLSWLSDATAWAAKITTVALEMGLPAVGGWWLDQRLGTAYWTIVGLVVGVPLGIWHLLLMTRKGPAGGE